MKNNLVSTLLIVNKYRISYIQTRIYTASGGYSVAVIVSSAHKNFTWIGAVENVISIASIQNISPASTVQKVRTFTTIKPIIRLTADYRSIITIGADIEKWNKA